MKSEREIWVPLFSTGWHGGREWTTADLDTMVRNAELLAIGKLLPPVAAGHNYGEPPILLGQHASAQPALGYVVALKREGNRLLGKLDKVPAFARRLITSGAYQRISAEILPAVEQSGLAKNLGTAAARAHGPCLVGAALLGASRPECTDLPALAGLYAENEQEGDEVLAFTTDREDLKPSVSDRVAAAEQKFAQLVSERAALLKRLARVHAEPTMVTYERTNMSDTNPQTFRDRVDADILANGGDVNDRAARLESARRQIRALQDVGEEVPDPQTYLDALKAQLTPATPGYGPDTIKVRQVPGGLGGLRPREPVANVFAERQNPTPRRTASEVHRLSDDLAAKDPSIGREYVSRVKTAPIPGHLAEMLHAELAKLDPTDRDALGKAMRHAAAKAPRAWLPLYGSAGR